jgi:hypothetical protein
MSAVAQTPEVAGPAARTWWDVAEVCLAVAAFAVLCVLVLRAAPYLPEPDDYAYRASIVAMTDGHFFTLAWAQAHALAEQLAPVLGGSRLGPGPGGGPVQWVQLPGGRWISEKDPGYPYLAVAFQTVGLIRLAPLFYGALGCLGLYAGGRRWLGRFGGAAAVGLYCSSGAASLFAWRDYMPTFTEASLIAAGTGALLWVVLAAGASTRRKTWVGLAGFAALEAATFSRYTNIVVLGCAVIAVLVAWRLRAGRLPGSAVAWWLASVCVFGAGVAVFDTLVYGGLLRSGYRPGEITFSLGALGPNLRYMPAHLIQAMPMLVLGLGGLAGIAVTWLRSRRAGGQQAAVARRDLAVALALAACWAAIWVLYATYTWTAAPVLSTLQAARFYVPALGAISLLGAWLLVRVPRRQPLVAVTTLAVVAALFGLGSWAFHDMYQHPFGSQLIVVPGPGGTVELEPGPAAANGGLAARPGRPAEPGIRRSSSLLAQVGRREPRENAGWGCNEAVVLTIRFPTIGGSARVLPGRACHSALRCRASISRGRGYRPGTGWTSLGEPIGGWPRVSMSGTAGGGPIMRRNPCGGHGRPPSGPHGTEGTVLICPCAAGRRGLPDGGSTRFYGGSTRWQGHRGGSCRSSGRLSPRCPEVGAS